MPGGEGLPPEVEELCEVFPEFDFVRLLGRGGMGAVYEARQPDLDRAVAVKILPRESAADPEFEERFRREARALAALDHPHIVTLHDFGEREGFFYFVMELVDGTDLAQRIDAQSLTTNEALGVVTQVCDALQYSHDKGVVHRDIKPANILLDSEGRVKIADFGLAKLVHPDGPDLDLTRTNTAIGTPRYMAPEQMESSSVADHRADIYALGVVLYELLTGEVPAGRFEAPSRRVEGLGDHFDDVVLRALDADAGKRFQSAAEVRSGLTEAMELRQTVPGGKRELARRFFLLRALPLAVLAGGAASAGLWYFVVRPDRKGEPTGTPGGREVALDRHRAAMPAGSVEGGGVPDELAGRNGTISMALGGSADREFGLLLDRSGQVSVWGDNRYGQVDLPEPVQDAVAVAAGCGAKGAHALALLANGEVMGWGDNSYGQAEFGAGGVQALAAGELHSMMLLDSGEVKVVGHGAGGVTNVPDLPMVKAIASGAAFCLALTEDGRLFSWGSNRVGQGEVPRWVSESTIIEIAAGDAHALALTADGKVYAWGADRDGQTDVPDDLGEVLAISAGANASAALTTEGLRVWGRFDGKVPVTAFAVALGRGSTAWLVE